MVSLQQYLLIALFLSAPATAETRFKGDDPLEVEPPPIGLQKEARERKIDELYDFMLHTFVTPRRYETAIVQGQVGPAGDINTIGEVIQSTWYTHRHYFKCMSREELLRGPGNTTPPSATGKWMVTAAKADGVTPGFTIKDDKGNRYLLKLDPMDYPEIGSAADVIGSKLFYALGYNTPENYVVNFNFDKLEVDPKATYEDSADRKVRLSRAYVSRLLYGQPTDEQGRYRALASRFIAGQPIGPFKYQSQRRDDPNDLVLHQDRRSLRGMRVFAAWTGHTDTKAQNSLDVVVEEDGRKFIKHYLIDFGSALGSDSLFIKEPSRGFVHDVDLNEMGRQAITFGLLVPKWMRMNVPDLRGVGRFESEAFDPRGWLGNYPNPAFMRMDEQDAFWAARQVAVFSDADLDALAATGEYTDERATQYVGRILRERRDKITQAYLNAPLRLDRFRIENGALAFDDVAALYAKRTAVNYQIAWAEFDNAAGWRREWTGVAGPQIPQPALALADRKLFVARITEPGVADKYVDVFLRRTGDTAKVIGVDRYW